MELILRRALELIDGVDAEATAAGVGRRFFGNLKPLGIQAIFARAHERAANSAHEHIYYREAPAGWYDMYAQRNFAKTNFVTRDARRRIAPFLWSSTTPPANEKHAQDDREMWDQLFEFGLKDGIAIPSHGAGYMGVVSLAWAKTDDDAKQRRAMILASHYVHERMLELTPPNFPKITLTRRERDCMAFVAEGKSDWDISQILGIAESTVHAHVENAKRRLGVKTRMQAVVKLVRAGEI